MINLFTKYSGLEDWFKFYPEIGCEKASAFFSIIKFVSKDYYEGLYFFDGCFIIKKAIEAGLSFNINVENKYCVKLANFLERSGINISGSLSKVFFNQESRN